MANNRRLEALRKEYDSIVSSARDHGSQEQKKRIVEINSILESELTFLPEKMIETKSIFKLQIENGQG